MSLIGTYIETNRHKGTVLDKISSIKVVEHIVPNGLGGMIKINKSIAVDYYLIESASGGIMNPEGNVVKILCTQVIKSSKPI